VEISAKTIPLEDPRNYKYQSRNVGYLPTRLRADIDLGEWDDSCFDAAGQVNHTELTNNNGRPSPIGRNKIKESDSIWRCKPNTAVTRILPYGMSRVNTIITSYEANRKWHRCIIFAGISIDI
jgi:hypothetical protein